MNIRYRRFVSPLGAIFLAGRDDALLGAWFEGQRHFAGIPPEWDEADSPLLVEAARQLDAYFAARLTVFDLPLAPSGTAFQQAIWRAIAAVPYGATTTYEILGRAAGAPGAARAAGAATGRNPLSIVVPCHRIVGASGALTGYAGGLARKEALLALESATRRQAA